MLPWQILVLLLLPPALPVPILNTAAEVEREPLTELSEILLFQSNVDQWPPARLKLVPSRKLAKEGVFKSDVNKEAEKRASEAALLDTVGRILRDELNALEQPGQLVSKGDIARFLQSAKARPTFMFCLFISGYCQS